MLDRRRGCFCAVLSAATAILVGCGDAQPPNHLRIADADPERGRDLVQALGCGACHTIPRVPAARGVVGPPLIDFAQRTIVAGHLPNVPRNLVPFLIDPPALLPDTAMPSLGLQAAAARDVAAFLYSLGSAETSVQPPDLALDIGAQPAPTAPLASGAARP